MRIPSPYDSPSNERAAIAGALVLLEDLEYRTPPRELHGIDNVKTALCARLLALSAPAPVEVQA